MDLSKTSLRDKDIYTKNVNSINDKKPESQSMEQNESPTSVDDKRSHEDDELFSKTNLCTIKDIDNGNILKSPATGNITENMDIHLEKVVGVQKEKLEVSDDVETIEKIAEMISISSKCKDENSPKSKKRLQILLSRSSALQNRNTFDEANAKVNHGDTKNTPLDVNHDNSNHDKIDLVNKKRKIDADLTTTKANEKSDVNFLEKSRFEEIEDKLEEMFAGIEDEQLVNTTNDDKSESKKFNSCLDEYITATSNDITTNENNKELFIEDALKYDSSTSHKAAMPTKAAQKSTTSLSSAERNNKNQLNILFRDYKNNLSIPKSMLYLKAMPPRRRFSIGLTKELLNCAAKTNEKINERNSLNNDITEVDMSPHPLNLKTNGDVKPVRKNPPKSKISKNNQKKCSKYKNEITDTKLDNSVKKKIERKSEPPIKDKINRQKIKQTRLLRLLSSENDTEEKQLQTRDFETKNRSPFILVKNNGSIAVVNTVAPDDASEKFTRSKKPNNYVFERKTVKGCYSSTLGNRYDADTADSSWICVFCKTGPHKKALGDLFGPYVISSDCDEYRSAKEYTNLANKSVTFINDTSNLYSQNSSKCNSKNLTNIYTSGITQVSADCYEIWIHEDCAIWAPSIYVVGSRLTGLADAIWNSTKYECVYCLKKGALLCCLQRNCKTTSHIPCARDSKWLLDESKFWVYCSKHALNKLKLKST